MLSSSPSLAHQRAAIAWQKGNLSQWVTAFYAARVVGNLRKGETLALAHDIAHSVDTVERLAKAAKAYRFLFRQIADNQCRRQLRAARRRLGYSHFVSAWKALVKEVDPREVLAELLTAADTGAGVRVLDAALEGKLGGVGSSADELKIGEYRLPTWDADSDMFRQAVGSGQYRVVLVDKSAQSVIVRYE